MPPADNFLSVLLNLQLTKIPRDHMKKVGPATMRGPDMRRPWQPKIFVNGQQIQGVAFAAWKTQWPQDGSELRQNDIEVVSLKKMKNTPPTFLIGSKSVV